MKKIPLKFPGLALALLIATQGASRAELVARWSMNEGSGTIADSSGNNLTGTPTALAVTNNALVYGQSSVAAGSYGAITVTPADAAKFGSSIQFIRAGSGMFQIGNPAVIGNLASAGPAGAFTVMGWVNASIASSTNQRIFATGPSNGWGVGLSNVNQVIYTAFGVVDRRSTTPPSANNVWQHVAYVWNAGAIEVFVNGTSKFTATAGFNNETSTQFGIGGNGNGGDHFNGRMDELKIFNTALTASEIVAAAVPPAVSGPLLAAAPTINFNNNGAPQVFSIPFSNESSTDTLTVTSVTRSGVDEAFFTVDDFPESVAPGGTGSVEVAFSPASSGPYQIALQIASNDAVSPSRTVTMNVTVSDPIVAASTARVDFGDLAANPGPQTMAVTLTNQGGATPLLVFGVSFLGQGGNGLSIVSSPESIAPGESGQVVIGFDPASATGSFGDLLSIETNATNTPILTLPVVAKVAIDAAETPVTVVNAGFNAGGWNSVTGTSPQGWTNSLAATNGGGLYGQDGALTPGLTSVAAHFQSVLGYYEQNLSAGNAGLTAGKVDAITVAFDRLYRNDAVVNGHAMLRVSLWDKTNDVELAGRDLVFENPGLQTGNTFTPVALSLAYDASTLDAEEIALRITRIPPLVVGVNINQATLVIDNVSVAVDGEWEPADGYASWTVATGLDGTPGKENGVADDPDKDGVLNFDEFAFGGNPLSGGSGVLSAAAPADTTGDLQRELILTVAVRADAEFSNSPSPVGLAVGATYAIQGSFDLVGFDALVEGPLAEPVISATLPAVPPTGYKYVSFRLGGSNGLPSKGFLRASATGN
ncbi:choice-of-anchor D domain-containing protein [Luteolibacter arcticus]|uniref:Choice-of-anchor D domain-containing protein n=1 Tax=Luteolibacter arcticus TaxID=1581411 RepID=A0ABT3GGV7_9BACT|nr:LamG-like jellyroll fold domain-containing protein [Luteolibacter arcticus]MCW1922846.1 choice-of-anchor D domain-containing protein [Luteolibacter arcticus]